jgi:hypothetical protein
MTHITFWGYIEKTKMILRLIKYCSLCEETKGEKVVSFKKSVKLQSIIKDKLPSLKGGMFCRFGSPFKDKS